MSAVTGVLNDLVRRRLWPVAVLLLGLAVAAPLLLAKDPEPVEPAPAAGPATAQAQPIASLVEDFASDARRRVLGAAKDPFTPTGDQPDASDSPTLAGSGAGSSAGTTADAGGAGAPSGGDSVASGGDSASSGGAPAGGGASPTTPVAPPVTTEAPPVDTYAVHSLKVRFDEGKSFELKRLAPLPDAEDPTIIYLGLLQDRRTAVFLLDERVSTQGDGTCHPSPSNCQRVHLRKGETQFFDVAPEDGAADADTGDGAEGEEATGTQHQLDLIDISTRSARIKGASRDADGSEGTSVQAGRKALRANAARAGRLRFDRGARLLRRVPVRARATSFAPFGQVGLEAPVAGLAPPAR